MGLFEERKLIEMAQRIKMRGADLSHSSTRTLKIQQMKDAFATELLPTLLPLGEMVDYDLLRVLFNDMMKIEGMGTLWQPGENPPQSVQDWWGADDWDIFRLYKNQNLSKEMMEMVRGRHRQYQKSALFYFKEKITACYRFRLGEEMVQKFNMRLPKADIDQIKQDRIRKENQEQNVRAAAAAEEQQQQREQEIAAAVEARVQEEVEARVQREVEARVRERTRQAAVATSPERRRKRPGQPGEGGEKLEVEGEKGDGRDELTRRMTASGQLEEDPDSSVLLDPAAVAVLRAPQHSLGRSRGLDQPGPSRPARQLYKCPYSGCVITRNSQQAISAHIENSHDD